MSLLQRSIFGVCVSFFVVGSCSDGSLAEPERFANGQSSVQLNPPDPSMSSAVLEDLGSGPGHYEATGINSRGHVIGVQADNTTLTNAQGFLRTPAPSGITTDLLPGLSGGTYSVPTAIGNRGVGGEIYIVGVAEDGAGGPLHAVRWPVPPGGPPQPPQDLHDAGGTESMACA